MRRFTLLLFAGTVLLFTACDRKQVAQVVLTLGINTPTTGEGFAWPDDSQTAPSPSDELPLGDFADGDLGTPTDSTFAENAIPGSGFSDSVAGADPTNDDLDMEDNPFANPFEAPEFVDATQSKPSAPAADEIQAAADRAVAAELVDELRTAWDAAVSMKRGTASGDAFDAERLDQIISKAGELSEFFAARGDTRQQDLARDTQALAFNLGAQQDPPRFAERRDEFHRQLFEQGYDDPTNVDAAVKRLITDYLSTDTVDEAATSALVRHATLHPECEMNVQLYVTLVDRLVSAGELPRAIDLAKESMLTSAEHPDASRLQEKLQQIYRDNAGAVGVPMVFVGPTLQGERLDLRTYRGKRLLVIFWASWNPTCRRELPRINELRERYAAEGLEVIGVSLDKSRGDLTKFVRENDLRWPQIYSDKASNNNWTNPIARHFSVSEVPHSFLLDTNGVVTANHLADAAEIEEAILSQLKLESVVADAAELAGH